MESLMETLKSIGLREKEVNVYIHLAKKGAKKAREISNELKIDRVQLYRILKNLQNSGMVESSFEHPAYFTAIPFEKVLDLFIGAKEEEARVLKIKRNSLLSQWRSLEIKMKSRESDKFMVIEGRSLVYSKIQQMVKETKDTLCVVTSSRGVVLAHQAGLITAVFNNTSRKKSRFRFLANLSKDNLQIIKDLIRRGKKNQMNIEHRHTDLGQHFFPRFLIRDDEELIFFLRTTEDETSTRRDTGLWTNNKVLVRAFKAFFEKLWINSIDFLERISEIESEKTV
jgi:sugar-specific transcriptional regulator TrmB